MGLLYMYYNNILGEEARVSCYWKDLRCGGGGGGCYLWALIFEILSLELFPIIIECGKTKTKVINHSEQSQ